MDSELERRLSLLPRLGQEHGEWRNCKICGDQSSLFDVLDFNKHCSSEPYSLGVAGIQIKYYRCQSCLFIFTDLFDNWNSDEFARFIYNADYAKVDPEYASDRPQRTAIDMVERLQGCEEARILDYGSGSGCFAGEMKRLGFGHVETYDPFSQPARPAGVFDLITSFEVIEHSPDPLTTLLEMVGMLSVSGAILVGQTMQPPNIDEIRGRWWYLAPRNGHVSTFADKTFSTMADKVGLIYRRGAGGLCGFARPSLAASIGAALERNMPVMEARNPDAATNAKSNLTLKAFARKLVQHLSVRQRRSIRALANWVGAMRSR